MITPSFGKLLYGALFVVALPIALALWAARLDALIGLPAVESPLAGAILAALGLLMIVATTASLWIFGRGLPMSVYPPERFVSRWTYRYLGHPIYVGAVIVCMGLSIALGSPAGLWIVTPVLAAAITAWVLGFERDLTRRHFAGAITRPLLRLPSPGAERPTAWDRISIYALVFLPWLVLFQGVETLGVAPDAVVGWMRWETAIPVLPWTELVYFVAYPFLLALPLVVATRSDARWFMTRGWVAIALIIPFYLLVPIIAPARPVVGDGLFETLMRWERAGDSAATAFPSFHVVWMLLAAVIYSRRWPRLAAVWWVIAIAVAVSCVTVGMHASVDVLASFLFFPVIARIDKVWGWLRSGAERLANSWREVTIGPMRLINHGIYAALGAALGVFLAVLLGGSANLWALLAIAVASIVGAALWAQLVEGSPQLLRPYGYYGSISGAIVALLVAKALGGDAWLYAAALAVGCSLAQVLGRARCLVQGCCHGAESSDVVGIRYTHPRSRVTRLSSLGGRALHPTQLYSALWMLTVTAVLLRLWMIGAGLEMIVGLYFVLTGLGRFVEEHYRGEPQTRIVGGLRLYQWLAIIFVIGGAAITTVGWTPAPAIAAASLDAILVCAAFGLAAYVAYGVDFPRLNARFSRLV